MNKKIKNEINKESKKDEQNSEIDSLKQNLARALADYDNLRKRTNEEKSIWMRFASSKIVEKLLPVLDMFEQAQVHLKDQGLAIALGEFKNVLKEEELEEIKPVSGEEYNNECAEVIDTIETDDESLDHKIEETLVSGWRFKDGPVIRHAKVKVYKIKN